MTKRSRLVAVLMLAICFVAASPAASPATATAAPLPVSYDFNTGIVAELTNPNGSLPGTNDWSCRPSPAHPRPLVLVHGGFASQQVNWGVYGPLLKNEGYCVYALTYGQIDNAPWPLSAIGALDPWKTMPPNSRCSSNAFARQHGLRKSTSFPIRREAWCRDITRRS